MRGSRRLVTAAVALVATSVTVLSGCVPSGPVPSPPADTAGPRAPFISAGSDGVTIVDGDDWSLPSWVRPAANSGYFSEDADAERKVLVRSVDVSWAQLVPSNDGTLDWDSRGEAQGMHLESLSSQLEASGPFWMRIFASGEEWAPPWVSEECQVPSFGPDYDGQRHLPIWDECVWGNLLEMYRALFLDENLAADPRLKFVYVPGAFTWAEYDYDIVSAAVDAGELDWETYAAWYSHAWSDLTGIFGEHATKLVFTGEDHPFGPFGPDDDLLARDAVEAGLGIRTGITELSNFHLNEAPAYGSRIQPNGHLVVDEYLPIHDAARVRAAENECYNDCGYGTDEPYYAVRQSNLKALQLRMNWMYIVPGPSYLREYPEHWDWVRLSLGKNAHTSADAWAALRDAEDTYWADNELGRFSEPDAWRNRPYVRNLERWLVQQDEPGSVAHRSTADVHAGVLQPENGTAYEGLSTRIETGDTGFVFELDERFAASVASAPLVVKVTFLDEGYGTFTIDTDGGRSPGVERGDSGQWRTATIALTAGDPGRFRISVAAGSDDLTVRFVRVVRVEP